MMDLSDLKKPFPPDAVHWRVGSTNQAKTRGMALAYIDARDVMDRLDEVCGPANWQSRFEAIGGRVVCSIGIYLPDDGADHNSMFWTWKSDGAGDTDFEPEKGGLSDAFKRAAVQWGIGRYLYSVDAPWVAIEQAGKSYKITESEMPKLRRLLSSDAAPARQMAQDERNGSAGHDTPPATPSRSSAAPRANGGVSRLTAKRAKEIMGALKDAPNLDALDKLWSRLVPEIVTASVDGQRAIKKVYDEMTVAHGGKQMPALPSFQDEIDALEPDEWKNAEGRVEDPRQVELLG